jgi:hypothetical protein
MGSTASRALGHHGDDGVVGLGGGGDNGAMGPRMA